MAPGLNPARLIRLMRECTASCRLDLRGSTVFSEAAAGAYVVTPIIAALAGAEQVYAVTRDSRYGTVEQVTEQTRQLANLAGVQNRLTIVRDRSPDLLHQADIVTNSGHVRPIDAQLVQYLKPDAVIPLMYEAWEFRDTDVDVAACRKRDIPVAGTNERHPAVDVFSYLGVMALKLLLDAGVAVYRCHILLLCDNPFAEYLERGLINAGARVQRVAALPAILDCETVDAIVVALRPRNGLVLDAVDAGRIAEHHGDVVIAQYWGDIDREALTARNIVVCPAQPVAPGHMGVLPSAVGPEPIIRLQTGGLKVGELLWRARRAGKAGAEAIQDAVDSGFAERLEEWSSAIAS